MLASAVAVPTAGGGEPFRDGGNFFSGVTLLRTRGVDTGFGEAEDGDGVKILACFFELAERLKWLHFGQTY